MPPRSDAHSGLAGPLSGGPGTGDLALGAPAGMGAGSASPQIDVEPPASPVPAADPANPAGPAWLTPVGVGPDRPQSELPAWALSVNDRLGSDRFDPVPPTTAPAGSVGSSSDSAADSPAALPTDSSAVGAPPLTVVSLPSAPLTMVSLPEAPPASTAPEQDWSAEPLGGSAEPDAAGPPAESATDWSALSFLDPADSDGSDLYPLTGATAPDRPEADQAGSGPAADSDPTASDLAADSDQADPSVAPPEEPVGETTLRLSEILPDSQGKGSALFGISDDVTAGLSPEMLDSAAEMGAALETSPPPAPPVWSQPASAPVATNLSQSTPQPSPIPDDLFRTRRIPSVAQVAAAAAAAAAEAVESSGDWGRLSTSPAKPPVGGDGGPRPPASTAAPAEDGAEPKRGRGALLAGIAAILIGLGLLAGLVVYLYSVWSPSDDPTPLPPPPTLPSVSPKPTPTVTPSQTPSSTPTVTPTATPTALTGKIPAEAHQACNTERTLGTASTQSTCAFAEVVAGNIPAGSRGEFTIQATAPSNNVTYTLQCSTLDVYYRCESTTGAVYFVVFR
jgi:hypothetical protein